MLKPPSIVLFERLYLGSFVLWIINTILFWNVMMAAITSAPGMSDNPVAPMIQPIIIGSTVFTALVTLVLWYLVARKASVVGKWILVVTEALGAIFALLTLLRLVRGTAVSTPMAAIALVATALAIAAAVVLFRPDAKAWFGENMAESDQPLP